MNSGLNGMPAVRESDPIINALLAKDEPYSFAEERRLFYVAITRAREATYLIANIKNPSPFIREIFDGQLVV
jgi:DNA helicase-4